MLCEFILKETLDPKGNFYSAFYLWCTVWSCVYSWYLLACVYMRWECVCDVYLLVAAKS
jgi:hypothetical protein